MKTAEEILSKFVTVFIPESGSFDALPVECILLDDAKLALAIYADMLKPNWIKVKDRLPDIGTMVLWYLDNEMGVGFYDGIDELSCTHWMPLPIAPHH